MREKLAIQSWLRLVGLNRDNVVRTPWIYGSDSNIDVVCNEKR
jgi:hypothetical protein